MTDARVLARLSELARVDEDAAAALAELDELAGEVEAIGARAGAVEARVAALPAERERTAASITEAEREREEHSREHERAAAAVADAERQGDPDEVRAARRAEVRARDRLRMAERRASQAREQVERVDGEGESVAREAEELVDRARVVAAALGTRTALAGHAGDPPDGSLAALADWATQVRAALFVARGRLAAERDAVIREANELGAAALGEPLSAQSAALVARRVERGA